MELKIKKYDMSYDEFIEKYHSDDNMDGIGGGSFGDVFKLSAPTGKKFQYPPIKKYKGPIVLKKISLRDKEGNMLGDGDIWFRKKSLEREYFLSRFLAEKSDEYIKRKSKTLKEINKRSYFIKIYAYARLPDCFVEYMELVDGYTLGKIYQAYDHLGERDVCGDLIKRIDESTNEFYIPLFMRLLEGLSIMHSNGIAHSDIKLENVMLEYGNVKYVDYGLTCPFNRVKGVGVDTYKHYKCKEIGGSDPYKSPEHCVNKEKVVILRNMKNYDMWSLGIMMLILIAKAKPTSVFDIDQGIRGLEKQGVKKKKGEIGDQPDKKVITLSDGSEKIMKDLGVIKYYNLSKKNKTKILIQEFFYENKNLFDRVTKIDFKLTLAIMMCLDIDIEKMERYTPNKVLKILTS